MNASTTEGVVRETAKKTKETLSAAPSTPLDAANAEDDGSPIRPDEPAPGVTDEQDEPSLSEADAAREENERSVEHTMPDDPNGDFA